MEGIEDTISTPRLIMYLGLTVLFAITLGIVIVSTAGNSPIPINTISPTDLPSICGAHEYYVRIIINDENGVDTTPFVDIKDPTGKQVFFGQTNQNGEITIPLCSLKKYNVTIMKENSCSVLFYPRESEYRMVCK
jgi:hypothetical protein